MSNVGAVSGTASEQSSSLQTSSWQSNSVVIFRGQYDSHASAKIPEKMGDEYQTLTLGEVFSLEPENKAKGEGLAMIPSTYSGYDARNHEVQRQHGSYVALVGDIDKGDYPIESIESAVHSFVGDGVAFLIYSSSSTDAKVKKWRVLIPLEQFCNFNQWQEIQEAFFGFMEERGLVMDWALTRSAQLAYLPNVPNSKRDKDGVPLFYQRLFIEGRGLKVDDPVIGDCLSSLRETQEKDDALAKHDLDIARQKSHSLNVCGNGSAIEEFNKRYSIDELLTAYGYISGPRCNWRSPYQTTKTFATKNFGDYWVSLSTSDAEAGLGRQCKSGRYGDAFELLCHFEHGGDKSSAVRRIAMSLGLASAKGNIREMPNIDIASVRKVQEDRFAAVQTQVTADDANSFESKRDSSRVFGVKDFMSELEPTFWIWQKILAKGWLYALAAAPGSGKTAVALLLMLRAAIGAEFKGRKMSQSRVLYLCGENPQDVRGRFDALLREHSMKLIDVEGQIFFTKSPFNIDDPMDLDSFIRDCQKYKPFDLCIIDTQKAHSGAEDEDSNPEAHELAQAIRRLGAGIGDPCMLTLSHPTKNPTRDTLLPRGGSAFTGSIDGVLCLWRESRGMPTELFTHKDKFRGRAFDGELFELIEVEHPNMVDNFGDPATTVLAKELVASADVSGFVQSLDDANSSQIFVDKVREACLRGELKPKTEWAESVAIKGDRAARLRKIEGMLTSGVIVRLNVPGYLVGKSRDIDVIVPSCMEQKEILCAAANSLIGNLSVDEDRLVKVKKLLERLDVKNDQN